MRKQPYRWSWIQLGVWVSGWPWPGLFLSFFRGVRIFVDQMRFLLPPCRCWFFRNTDFTSQDAKLQNKNTFQHSTISPILISTCAKNFGSAYLGPSCSGSFFSAYFFGLGYLLAASLGFFYYFFFYSFLGYYFFCYSAFCSGCLVWAGFAYEGLV